MSTCWAWLTHCIMSEYLPFYAKFLQEKWASFKHLGTKSLQHFFLHKHARNCLCNNPKPAYISSKNRDASAGRCLWILVYVGYVTSKVMCIKCLSVNSHHPTLPFSIATAAWSTASLSKNVTASNVLHMLQRQKTGLLEGPRKLCSVVLIKTNPTFEY